MNDNFLNPSCTPYKLDTFLLRQAILRSLKAVLSQFKGVILDVGCGEMPYRSLVTSYPSKVTKYIGLDLEDNPIHSNSPDIVWLNGKIPLGDASVDSAICTEVFEHCPDPEHIMKEVLRVLKPEGIIFFTVPFLWPLHEVPFDEYRYTPFSLHRHLYNSGFNNIQMQPLGGWDASLAQMLGLWARRRPMPSWMRMGVSLLAWPFVFFLSRLDSCTSELILKEGSMLIGLCGTAKKPSEHKS